MNSNGQDSLDVILAYMQRNGLSCCKSAESSLKGCHFPYHTYAVVKGRFAFQVHCHDTGNSVRAYILTDEKPFEIISATYWKQSGYGHNPDKFESGAWDKALNEAITEMQRDVKSHKASVEAMQRKEVEKVSNQYKQEKLKAESYFK